MAKRNGGAVSGSVCSCELSLGDGHCRSTTPTLTTTALSSTPALTASALSSTPALTTRAPPFRLAGNECVDPQVLTETDTAGCVSRGRTRQTEPQTRKRTRYRKRALPSPYTLARRRFRLAGNCTAVPIMKGYRQGQAFSVWRDGQTEWRCGDR